LRKTLSFLAQAVKLGLLGKDLLFLSCQSGNMILKDNDETTDPGSFIAHEVAVMLLFYMNKTGSY
jgi:hypothetical protein